LHVPISSPNPPYLGCLTAPRKEKGILWTCQQAVGVHLVFIVLEEEVPNNLWIHVGRRSTPNIKVLEYLHGLAPEICIFIHILGTEIRDVVMGSTIEWKILDFIGMRQNIRL
jgi:hypothetical protein